MVQCLFMHCSTRGRPLHKRCAQRLCNDLPTTKNILSCTLCDIMSCLYFSCQINNFQVQVQVQIHIPLLYYNLAINITFAIICNLGVRIIRLWNAAPIVISRLCYIVQCQLNLLLTVTSHKLQSFRYHLQVDCLFISFFGLTTKKPKLHILVDFPEICKKRSA